MEGDKTTIETVKEKVNNNIPVVICAGTGSNRVFDYGQGKEIVILRNCDVIEIFYLESRVIKFGWGKSCKLTG